MQEENITNLQNQLFPPAVSAKFEFLVICTAGIPLQSSVTLLICILLEVPSGRA